MFEKISLKIQEYRRIIRLTKKPSKQEFSMTVKVSALGMLIIGLVGFAITIIKAIITGGI